MTDISRIDRKRSCLGKKPYRRRKAAKTAAAQMSAEHGERFRVYRCLFAHHWHVSHTISERFRLAAFRVDPPAAQLEGGEA